MFGRERETVLRPARHIIGQFGDESLQAITCTGTDNSKQTRNSTSKTQNNHKINKLSLDNESIQNTPLTKPKSN